MTKNMTRKGLAIGASAALLSASFIVTAPAVAAESLSLAPSAGTSYKVLTTTEFELTTGFTGSESSGAVGTLKYLVSNPSGATMAFDVTAAGVDTGTTTDIVEGTTSTNAAATAASVVVTDDSVDALGSRSGLAVAITPVADTSASITVQAFLDLDGSNSINGSEATSPARTIEFTDHAAVTGSATLDTAVVGAFSLSATAALPGINMSQLDVEVNAEDVRIEFFKNNVSVVSTNDTADAGTGTGFTALGAKTAAERTNPVAGAWSISLAELRATLAVDANTAGGPDTVFDGTANVSGAVYSAKIRLYDGSAWQTVANSVGAATPSSGQVSALSGITESASASTDGADNVRTGAGSFAAKTTATVNGTFAKSGNPVTFTVSEAGANTVASAASIIAGGKTLTNSNLATVQSVKVEVLTDADGIASLTLDYSGIATGNTFTVSATALNTGATVATPAIITYTAVASDVEVVKSNVTAGKLQTVVASTFAASWTLADSFGQVPIGTYRLVLTEDSSSANYAQTLAFVNGVVSFTQIENSSVANTYILNADVQQQNADLTWDATPTSGNSALNGDINVNTYATDPTVSSIAVSASNTGIGAAADLALELDATYTGDKDLQANSVAFPTLTDVTTLTYTVTSSTGEALVGESITLSAAGLQFAAASDKVFGVGSVSGTTDASGQFVAKVYSNFAGSQTVTATSGAVTKTQELVFAQAKDDTGTVLALSAPTYAEKGSTFKVIATLTDKYGNLVTTSSTATNFVDGTTAPTFAMTYTGPGLIVGNLPGVTVNGLASFSVLLGSNDTGDIGVTVSYDADGTATAFDVVAAAASVILGAEPVVSTGVVNAGSFNGYVAVYAKGHKGSTLSWKIAGKWFTTEVTSDYQVFQRKTVDVGVAVLVDLYVDRSLELSKAVLTK
jgi:hypothetical protein